MCTSTVGSNNVGEIEWHLIRQTPCTGKIMLWIKYRWNWSLFSIPPTFYDQLLCIKVFFAAFMFLQLGFVIFRQKEIGTKAARKMLVKLTPGFIFFTADERVENIYWKRITSFEPDKENAILNLLFMLCLVFSSSNSKSIKFIMLCEHLKARFWCLIRVLQMANSNWCKTL